MEVIFRRTGERRYAVIVRVPGRPAQTMDPAPGYDEHIPHDLVHYVVEAELGLTTGVFGRAGSGGGTFVSTGGADNPRERARQRRKQAKREGQLNRADDSRSRHMASSERLAGLCDLAWRRRHGQRPDPDRVPPTIMPTKEEVAQIERVLATLDNLAPVWNSLPIDAELAFAWPSVVPRR